MRVSSNRRPRGGRANTGGNRTGSGNNRRPNGNNRNYDSNGPDGKIRGTASQVYDKYVALGTDAQNSGDRVAAENYFQHAEHYFRIIAANSVPVREKQNADSTENTTADDGQEKEAQGSRQSKGRGDDNTANSDDNGKESADQTSFVDLSTAEQPEIELAASGAEQSNTETSEEDEGTAKPKRKVSRTRTLRRRTSSRNNSENDTEEVNTTE